MAKNLYKLLAVDEDADPHTITKAYRKLALQYHPDKQAGKTDKEKEESANKFTEIGNAYAILNDPKNRNLYDKGLINDQGKEVEPKEDVFNQQPRRRTHAAHAAHPAEPHRPFFKKSQQPTHYFIFNSKNDARSFHPEYIEGPRFVYVITNKPLYDLFEIVNTMFRPNHKPTISHSKHTTHATANGYSSTYHRQVDNHPEHVSIKTNYAQLIEQIIDRLIQQQLFRLELLEKLSQEYGHERPNDNDSGPIPRY